MLVVRALMGRRIILLTMLLLALPVVFVDSTLVHTDTDESKLKTDMLSSYERKVRPVLENSNAVNVSISAAFAQLVEVNQISGIVTVVIWIRHEWNDAYLAWTESSYGNIGLVTNYASQIWIPNVLLLNEAQKYMDGMYFSNVYSYSSGYQYWSRPGTVKFLCEMDLGNFPFDVQRCTLQFGSWDYSGLLQDIISGTGTQDMGMVHSEWEVTSIEVERNEIYYPCCPSEPWPELKFTLVMKRRPEWYFVYLIFPTLVVTAIMMAGFFIHPTSGERVGLGVTSLLTTIALLFIAKDQLPVSSQSTVIGDFFMGCILYNLVSFMETTLVIYLTWLPRDHKNMLYRMYNVVTTMFWSFYDKYENKDKYGQKPDFDDMESNGKVQFNPPVFDDLKPGKREGGGTSRKIDPSAVDLSMEYGSEDTISVRSDEPLRPSPRNLMSPRVALKRMMPAEGGGGGAPNPGQRGTQVRDMNSGEERQRRPRNGGSGQPEGARRRGGDTHGEHLNIRNVRSHHEDNKKKQQEVLERDARARAKKKHGDPMNTRHDGKNQLDAPTGSGFRDPDLVLKAGSDFGRPEPRRIMVVRGDWMDFSRMLRVALVIDKVFRIFIPFTFSIFIIILFSIGAANQDGVGSGSSTS